MTFLTTSQKIMILQDDKQEALGVRELCKEVEETTSKQKTKLQNLMLCPCEAPRRKKSAMHCLESYEDADFMSTCQNYNVDGSFSEGIKKMKAALLDSVRAAGTANDVAKEWREKCEKVSKTIDLFIASEEDKEKFDRAKEAKNARKAASKEAKKAQKAKPKKKVD